MVTRLIKHSFQQYLGLSPIRDGSWDAEELFKQVSKLREAAGKLRTERKLRKAIKSMYDYFQPWSMRTGKQSVNIEKLNLFQLINTELERLPRKSARSASIDDPPLVIVERDAMPYVDCYETKVEGRGGN